MERRLSSHPSYLLQRVPRLKKKADGGAERPAPEPHLEVPPYRHGFRPLLLPYQQKALLLQRRSPYQVAGEQHV